MKMKKIKSCPFCGADGKNVLHYKSKKGFYVCNECGSIFNEEDIEHELLRQKVSAICSREYATEDNPIVCDDDNHMELHIDLYEVSQGLSEMEKPMVKNIFQDEEGIVWLTIDFEDEPIELDSILTDSIREVLQWLEEEL